MRLTLLEKIKLKAIYKSCQFMGLEMIGLHLIAPKYLTNKSVVFDFGANLGSFAHKVIERTQCQCICLEPNPIVYAKISPSEHIKKINAAVSESPGNLEFFISKNPEASSFFKQIASAWGVQEVIKVKTYTYSDITKGLKVDLLKVDIEGAEIGLFNGMSNEQLLAIPQITVEFHEFIDPAFYPEIKAIIARFKSLGFLMVNYSLKSFSDILFINRKHINWRFTKQIWYKFHCIFRYNG